MKRTKYPIGLFAWGVVTDFLFRFFWLSVPCVVLLIVGIFVRPCLYIGLFLLALDLILSFAAQIQIRNTFLKDSDNPDFSKFQDALSKDGNWIENTKAFVEDQINGEE